MPLVLVVDDVKTLAGQYAYDLKRLAGYATRVATSGKEALDILMIDAVDCLILDLEMPGMDGFEVLRRIKKDGFDVPVIVYTGTGNYDRCVQAIKLGAFSFIDKAESMERVAQEVANAIERRGLQAEVTRLKTFVFESALTGNSESIRALDAQITRVASASEPVMILGESGVGKERVAHAVHKRGPRAEQPFLAINCSALPEALIESMMFGHERGAFTGASERRRGVLEAASGGTLFMDEVVELTLANQAKLLRAIEQGEIMRIGSEKVTKIDVRIIAATNQDPLTEVKAKRFREDLYYRLNVHVLRVPPLRERPSDIPEIANELLSSCCYSSGIARKRFAPDVIDVIMAYDWPGNVRELRALIAVMVLAAEGDVIDAKAIPKDFFGHAPLPRTTARSWTERKTEAERQIVVAALARNDGNIGRTASDLGLADHASLLKIMRRLGIKPT